MRSHKVDEFFNKAIDKMFQMVGFKSFDKDFAKQDKWYSLKTWTATQEKEFKHWFLLNAKESLKWSNTISEKEYAYFNLMYGWSLSNDSSSPQEKTLNTR